MRRTAKRTRLLEVKIGAIMSWLNNACSALSISPSTQAVLQGQWISILIAGTGVFATILSSTRPNANFPLLMNLFNYVLLSLFLFRKLYRDRERRKQEPELFTLASLSEDFDSAIINSSQPKDSTTQQSPVYISKWLYFLAAFLDVEANFLVLEAYNYTNITSIMLLDCFTIPCVMALSYFFLGCRYKWKHGVGVVLCLFGLICIVINDVLLGNTEASSNALIGDLLCIGGCIFYACSNVIEETMVKFTDKDEYLGYLGSFGIVIALIQCMIVDLADIRRANFTAEVILSMCGFILCLFFMYVNTTAFLQQSDATLFNLSLLTSDVYAVIFTYFFQGYLVGWLYFVAFGFVMCGLLLYHSEKPPLQLGKEEGSAAAVQPAFLTAFSIRRGTNYANDSGRQRFLSSSGGSGGGGKAMHHCNSMRFEYNPIIIEDMNNTENASSILQSPSTHGREGGYDEESDRR